MNFPDWLRKWAERVPLGKDGTGLRLTGQQLDDLANLAAQDHEALVELRRTILQHSPCMVHEDCAPAEEQAATAIQAGEDFKEQYE